jgi:type III secretory pathway lipoprotein EscJ
MDVPRARESVSRINAAQVIACGIVAASLGWSVWLLRDRPLTDEVELLPGRVLSYSDLAPVEAAFDRAQLTDHRTEEGRIWVPRSRQSAYMRALVEAEALPQKLGTSQHRALKETSPFQSRTALEETLRVARQEELKNAICSMPGVEDAVVLYDVDEEGGLAAGLAAGKVRTASVHVRTKPDADLQPIQAQTIRVAVAASIAGLSADRVAVIDLRSGVHYTGPLAPAGGGEDAAADPELARRVAHERHLAEKVRTAVSFVKGAVVTVTVALPAPVAAPAPVPVEPPRLREPADRPRPQRVADANAPAEVGRSAPREEVAPPPAPLPSAVPPSGPESILVSISIPDESLRAAVHAVRQREPGLAEAAAERREIQRIRDHVLQILPATPVPEGRQVVVTTFPAAAPRAARHEPARPAVQPPPAPPAKTAEGRPTPGQLLDAAWIALAGGRPGDVPREVWLVAIGVASTLLAWLVLRAGARPARADVPRRRQTRIDWSRIDEGHHDDEAPAPRRVAA